LCSIQGPVNVLDLKRLCGQPILLNNLGGLDYLGML
jgi:hypothetical protein